MYYSNCGAKIPISVGSFCHNCGGSINLLENKQEVPSLLVTKVGESPKKLDGEDVEVASLYSSGAVYGTIRRLKWRDWISLFKIFLILTLGLIAIGASISLSKEAGSNLVDVWKGQLPEISALTILINNLRIAYLMMIPVIGIPIAAYALFNTGLVISAQAASAGVSGLFVFPVLLIFPFSWLEFFAYSAAMTQGIFLLLGLVRRRFRVEAVRTGVVAAIIFVLLLIGSLVEILFI